MKCKYRVRWINSKGASLVLLWTLLVCIACVPFMNIFLQTLNMYKYILVPSKWYLFIPVSMACLSALLGGWLADTKFGNYKIFRAGVGLLFLYATLSCLLFMLDSLYHWESHYRVKVIVKWIQFSLFSGLFMPSISALIVTSLPLGLEQMPDASATSITSFIAWFVCSIFIAAWLTDTAYLITNYCLQQQISKLTFNINMVGALLSAICISGVLVSNFLLSPKWLVIEHTPPQSLHTIFGVIKFAAKHRNRLNLCTFYINHGEVMPSRLDLGKMRYGGPFTAEQVEDVKTILRLLVISMSLFFVLFFLNMYTTEKYLNFSPFNISGHDCITSTVYLFTFDIPWSGIFSAMVYEVIVYPLFRNQLPGILKRIGTIVLMITLVSFICFILEVVYYVQETDKIIDWIAHVLFRLASGVLSQALLNFVLEFMCAQSPYTMRGLFMSFSGPLILISSALGLISGHYFNNAFCKYRWCPLVLFSAKAMACLLGFLVLGIAARWYKRRVRGDDPQQEQYNRYLTDSVS